MIKAIFHSLRPKQWTKNGFLFAGLFFSRNLANGFLAARAAAAFALFCLVSSAGYLINDVLDREKDRAHPVKKARPVASGALPVWAALFMAVIMLGSGIGLAFRLGTGFGMYTVAYALLTIGYSLALKHVMILDLLVVACGFVLRAAAGAVVIDVSISSWLLLCTIFLALFLIINKRRHERVAMGGRAEDHRSGLSRYSPYLLDQMSHVVTASMVMAYALYTMAEETVEKFHTRNLILTIPFVLFGIFRYQYAVHQEGKGDSPEAVLLHDLPFLVNIGLYLAAVAVILYL